MWEMSTTEEEEVYSRQTEKGIEVIDEEGGLCRV